MLELLDSYQAATVEIGRRRRAWPVAWLASCQRIWQRIPRMATTECSSAVGDLTLHLSLGWLRREKPATYAADH